jgi:S-formylglutathione hydrolase
MATLKSVSRLFGGELRRFTHKSSVCKCDMTFAVYLPPGAGGMTGYMSNWVPALYWLSGLTCTDENFSQKSGFARAAARRGLAVVIPDTSPRGVTIEGADDSYDFGSGAGFYVDATEPRWRDHYNMYSYVTKELPALVDRIFDEEISSKKSISGHSMGGHGALTIALRSEVGEWTSSSAFAPICHPTNCLWGQKAFNGYLGSVAAGEAHDAALLARSYTGPPLKFLVDQGTADDFLTGDTDQLQPGSLVEACKASGGRVELDLRLRDGYDHSYNFISSFIDEHIDFHADALGASGV